MHVFEELSDHLCLFIGTELWWVENSLTVVVFFAEESESYLLGEWCVPSSSPPVMNISSLVF